MAVAHKLETKEEAPVVVRLNACPHPGMFETVVQGALVQELQVIVVVIQVDPVPQPLQSVLITM